MQEKEPKACLCQQHVELAWHSAGDRMDAEPATTDMHITGCLCGSQRPQLVIAKQTT
jgi:hypothetical protein